MEFITPVRTPNGRGKEHSTSVNLDWLQKPIKNRLFKSCNYLLIADRVLKEDARVLDNTRELPGAEEAFAGSRSRPSEGSKQETAGRCQLRRAGQFEGRAAEAAAAMVEGPGCALCAERLRGRLRRGQRVRAAHGGTAVRGRERAWDGDGGAASGSRGPALLLLHGKCRPVCGGAGERAGAAGVAGHGAGGRSSGRGAWRLPCRGCRRTWRVVGVTRKYCLPSSCKL